MERKSIKGLGGVSVKAKGKQSTGLGLGVFCSLLLTFCLTALEASLAERLVLPVNLASGLSVAVWILSAFLGGYLCAKATGQGTLPKALLCGGIYGVMLLVLTGLLFQAKFQSVLKGFAIILASSATGGVLASGGGGATGKKIRFR